MADLNDIFDNSEELSKDQLMDYLSGNLSDEAMHDLEKQMADSELMNDAVEGLQSFSSPDKAKKIAARLTVQLNTKLKNKNRKNKRKPPMELYWTIIAVVIILVLCLLAYFVIAKKA
jgi:lipopolysaccharide export LptBFGC system permease protein LptF